MRMSVTIMTLNTFNINHHPQLPSLRVRNYKYANFIRERGWKKFRNLWWRWTSTTRFCCVAMPHFSTLKPPSCHLQASLFVNEENSSSRAALKEEKLLEKIIYESVMSEKQFQPFFLLAPPVLIQCKTFKRHCRLFTARKNFPTAKNPPHNQH